MNAEGSVVWDLISRDRSSATNERVGRSFDDLSGRTSRFGSVVGALAGAAKYGAVALGGLATAAGVMGVKTLASLETTQIGFETLLGSAKKANDYITWMKKFAEKTPFELEGLTDSARLLLGVGASAKESKQILQSFGDTAGAVGMSQARFQAVMLATSQMISSGKVNLGDLNQLVTNGIPVWKLLSEAMGKPVPVLRDMISKGELMTDEMLPALMKEMNKDYGGAMERQAGTLTGMWSTFMDTINLGLADALLPFQDEIKTGLGKAIEVVGSTFRKIPGWVDTARDAVGRLKLGDLFDDAKDAFERAKAWGGKVLDGINAAIETGDWKPLGEFLGGELRKALASAWDGLGDLAAEVDWLEIGKTVGATAIPFAIGFLETLFDPLMEGEFWKKHWDSVLLAAVSFVPFGKAGTSLGVRVLEKIGLKEGLIHGMATGFQKAMGWAVGAVWGVVKWIGRQFGRGFQKTSGEAASRARGFVKDIIETGILKALYAKDKVMDAAGKVIGWIPKKAGELVGWAVGKLEKIGRDIIGGLISGIRGKITDLKNAVTEAANAIPEWLKEKLHIKSPSRITMLIGRDVVRGLVKGITDNTGQAQRAVEKLTEVVGRALDRHRQKLSDLKASYRDVKGGIVDAFRMDLSGAGTTMSDILANYRDRASSGKRMASVIARLRKMGLRNDLLQQLAEQGPEGLAQANAILGSGRSGIRDLNALQKQINGYGAAAGTTVANQRYADAIRAETRAVRALERIQRDVREELRELNRALKDGKKHIDAAMLRRELYRLLKQGAALGAK